MPQGLSAGPQRPTRPGPAGGPRKSDRPGAPARTSARPAKRPAQRGHVSPPGTARLELQQHGEQLVVAEPGPPRSQRHHERAGPTAGQFHDSPKPAILCEPANRRPAPSGTPYSAIRNSRASVPITLSDYGWSAASAEVSARTATGSRTVQASNVQLASHWPVPAIAGCAKSMASIGVQLVENVLHLIDGTFWPARGAR